MNRSSKNEAGQSSKPKGSSEKAKPEKKVREDPSMLKMFDNGTSNLDDWLEWIKPQFRQKFRLNKEFMSTGVIRKPKLMPAIANAPRLVADAYERQGRISTPRIRERRKKRRLRFLVTWKSTYAEHPCS
jgi:hypothetical protein